MFGQFQVLKKILIPVPTALALVVLSTATPGQTTTTPTAQPPARTTARPKAAPATGAKLDLNKATAEELAANLPGVGAVTAGKIVAGRPYAKVDDLAKAGVPARTIEAIRPLVVVTTAAPKAVTPRPTTATTVAPTGKKVNINTATKAELLDLPGIGPTTADALIAGRPFKAVYDLEKVRGLGPAKLKVLRDLVIVAEPTPAPAPEATTTNATRAATTPAARTRVTTKPAPRTTTPARTAGRGGLSPGQVVDINKDPKEVLDLLPGIGPVKAQAIIEAREKSPFKTKEDIMKVKGIKEGEFSKIKDLIKVD